MATTLITNFSYNGKNPNFERDSVAKISDLLAVKPANQVYDYGHIVFCEEDGKHYKFIFNYSEDNPSSDAPSTTTGWFQEFAAGGSVDLSGYVTDSELTEALSLKVDAESGKGLSTNDFTTTLKNKLDGIEASANKYIHPNDGEEATGSYAASNPTSLEGAETIKIPTFTINKFGHVTSAGTNVISVPDFSKFAISIHKDDYVAGVIDGQVDISDFFSNLQEKLVSGRTIKTINNFSILGEGNIEIAAAGGGITAESDPIFTASPAYGITDDDIEAWNNKSDFSGSYNDLSNKPTIPSIDGLATTEQLNAKQDKISDLATIRSGADKGATAVQNVQINNNPITQPDDGTIVLVLNYSDINGTPTFKTINGVSIIKSGDNDSDNIDLSGYVTDSELTEALSLKVDAESGKGLSTNDFTTTLKNKLDGIEADANKYIHPNDGEEATGSYAASNPTSLEGAETIKIPTFTINKFGHVTSAGTNVISVPDFSKFAISIHKDDYVAGAIDGQVDISDFFSNLQEKLVSGSTIKTINGQSLVGSGNITIESGSAAYALVNHGMTIETFTLTPNTFHVWREVSSLTLTLGAETSGVANEYLFQFTAESGGATLSLPAGIKWAGGAAPSIEAYKTYQISVLNNCATYLCFE